VPRHPMSQGPDPIASCYPASFVEASGVPVRFAPAVWMRLLWSERYTVPNGRASRSSTTAWDQIAPSMWRNALIPVTGPPAERDTESPRFRARKEVDG
jgi:hypothetical protein